MNKYKIEFNPTNNEPKEDILTLVANIKTNTVPITCKYYASKNIIMLSTTYIFKDKPLYPQLDAIRKQPDFYSWNIDISSIEIPYLIQHNLKRIK